MLLKPRRSTFNFFESFSDLVFCTLVMFLVLVMFLALNVNVQVEDLQDEQAAAETRRAQLEADLAELAEGEQAFYKRRAQIQQQQALLSQQSQTLRQQTEAAQARRAELQAMEQQSQQRREQLEALALEAGRRALELQQRQEADQRRIAQLEQLEAQTAERAQQMQQLEQQAAARRAELESLQQQTAERVAALETAAAEATQRAEQLAAQEQQAEARQARLEQLEDRAAQRQAQLSEQARQLQDQQNQLQEMTRQAQQRQTQQQALQAQAAARQAELDQLQQQVQQRATQLEQQQAQARERQDQLDAMAQATQQRAADLQAQRLQLDSMTQRVQADRQRLERMLGTQRFTGTTGPPRIVVAYELRGDQLRVHPIPAWLIDRLNTRPQGLTPQQQQQREAAIRRQFARLAEQVPPLSPEQYRAVIQATSIARVATAAADDPTATPAVSLQAQRRPADDDSGRGVVAAVEPGGVADVSGVRPGDVLIAMDGQPFGFTDIGEVLAGYRSGDEAVLTVQRDGQSLQLPVVFTSDQTLTLEQLYRPGMSYYLSGATDEALNYVEPVEPAQQLVQRLQSGEAIRRIWGEDGVQSAGGQRVTRGRPVLRFDVAADGQRVLVGEALIEPAQLRRLLESVGGGGIAVEYAGQVGPAVVPDWVVQQVLIPTGYVNQTPELRRVGEADEGAG
jgi:hypothetical protein